MHPHTLNRNNNIKKNSNTTALEYTVLTIINGTLSDPHTCTNI